MARRHRLVTLLSALTHKGYPAWAEPLPLSAIGQQGWSIHQPDWPLPSAVLSRDALRHNLHGMQHLVGSHGVELAPHGKTTLSLELMRQQLQAGAWGLTVATVAQLAHVLHGLAAPAPEAGDPPRLTRLILANTVTTPHDLRWLLLLLKQYPHVQIALMLDDIAQIEALEAAWQRHACPGQPAPRVLIELGLEGGRGGCRDHAQALHLAERASASPAAVLTGLACYEGLAVQGEDAADRALVHTLTERLRQLLHEADQRGAFARADAIWLTAGGSAVFDLVLRGLRTLTQPGCALSKPAVGILRAGCYLSHDDGAYARWVGAVRARLAANGSAACFSGLHAALRVWCAVQSQPEPGLAVLNAGKRDLSHDAGLPVALRALKPGQTEGPSLAGRVRITRLYDQHAVLQWDAATFPEPPVAVGDRIELGISHPCTTFDRWRWMPVVDGHGRIVDAIATGF